jgi:hypothetical protein
MAYAGVWAAFHKVRLCDGSLLVTLNFCCVLLVPLWRQFPRVHFICVFLSSYIKAIHQFCRMANILYIHSYQILIQIVSI